MRSSVLISSFSSIFGPINDVCHSLTQRVCPLFVLKGPKEPYLIGSGVPIQIGALSAIATAAHVLAPYGAASVLTLGPRKSVVLSGERRGYGYKPGQTVDVDLALIVLEDDERDELRERYTFSYSFELGVARRPEQVAFYGIVGYPQSRNKLSPKLQRSGVTVANYFISRHQIRLSAIRAVGKYDNVHFAIGADANGAIGLRGERVSFPSPVGMSGGGVWLLEFSLRAEVPPTPRLVGIGIEYWRKPGAVICTRVENLETMVGDLLLRS